MNPITSIFNWNRFREVQPACDVLVLVFRIDRKKYVVAKLDKDICPEAETEFEWITQHNCCHPARDDDAWIAFIPYSCTWRFN